MPDRPPLTQVLLVSRNDQTAPHLQEYFEARGLSVERTSTLGSRSCGCVPASVVVFPDEFPLEEVEVGILSLLDRYPGLSLTLITRDTQHFNEFLGTIDESRLARFSVLPRPAFSWTILERVITPLVEDD